MFLNIIDFDFWFIWVFLVVVDVCGIIVVEVLFGVWQLIISMQLLVFEVCVGFKLCDCGCGGFCLMLKGECFVVIVCMFVVVMFEFVVCVCDIDCKLVGMLLIGLIGQVLFVENVCVVDVIGVFCQCDQVVMFVMKVVLLQEFEESFVNNQFDFVIGYFWYCVLGLFYMLLFIEQQVIYCGCGYLLFYVLWFVMVDDL